MRDVDCAAQIIAGKRRPKNTGLSLDKQLLLDYFVGSMDRGVLGRMVGAYSVKEVICADYAGCSRHDLGGGLLYACCETPVAISSSGISAGDPDAADKMAAAVYIRELEARGSKSLVLKARNIQQLKAILFADALAGKAGYTIDSSKPIEDIANDFSSRYRAQHGAGRSDREGGGGFNPAMARLKYPLLGLAAAGLLGTAVCTGIHAYTDWNASQNSSYCEALDELAECETYLLSEKYGEAHACGQRLAFKLRGGHKYYSSRMIEMTDSFSERLQEDMGQEYSVLITQAEAEISLGHYGTAEDICSRIETGLADADYFNDRAEILAKADDIEKQALEKKSGQQIDKVNGGLIDIIGEYLASGYSIVRGLYAMLGLGRPLSDILAALTIGFPVFGVARKIKRRAAS